MDEDVRSQIDSLEQAIAAQETARATLGDAAVDAAVAALREKLSELQSQVAQPGQQRKQITVLFADVSGFTAMSEALDAEVVGETMNALWARLDGVIVEHGGLIDKHIGDAVMALWGVEVSREDDPERAIRAALEMHETLGALVATVEAPLQMRIGIHTGPVLLGEVGTTGEFTAMGGTVNFANRMESAAPVGGVLISHDTYQQVRSLFEFTARDPISVKGRSEPVQVYEVEGLAERAFRPATRGVEGVETRMVGREAELQQLREAMRTAISQRVPQVVTIVGDAGVGKSRLLFEFGRWLALQPEGVTVFKGRSSEEMEHLPYALLRDVLVEHTGIKESDSAQVARDKLSGYLLNYASEEHTHFIGHLLGFDFAGSPYIKGILEDAQQIRNRAFHYMARFFAAVTADAPAAIFLEDIHWADGGSLDLMAYVADVLREDVPLLIVALSRPDFDERRPDWATSHAQHTRITLDSLSAQASARLVNDILQKVPKIPNELRELIVKSADGNPFYVEELVKMLVDDGVITTGADEWQVHLGQLKQVKIPGTLTGVLQARLDKLPTEERGTLQRASVVGRIFWDGAVQRIAVDEDVVVGETLNGLQSRELIFGRDESAIADSAEYIFKHAILRDVTYESVLLKLRKVYHKHVADWLVEQVGERVNEYLGVIASHYERAGEDALSGEWYFRAGEQAWKIGDLVAMETYGRKALDMLPENDPNRLESYFFLGISFGWQARVAQALETFQSMLDEAEASGNRVMVARACFGLSQINFNEGDSAGAVAQAVRAIDEAREAGEAGQVELARALALYGWSHYQLGDAARMIEAGEKAYALATQIGDAANWPKSLSLSTQGAAYNLLGEYDKAEFYQQEMLDLARSTGNRFAEGSALSNLGESARHRGDYSFAVAFNREAISIAEDNGSSMQTVVFSTNLGGSLLGLGDYATAQDVLQRALQKAQSTGIDWIQDELHWLLAEAKLRSGNPDEALDAGLKALDLAQAHESPESIGWAWRALGMIAGGTNNAIEINGESYDASACFAQSLQTFRELGNESYQAHTLKAWAEHELAHGDAAHGKDLWQQARDLFERNGADKMVERMDGDQP